ncbi:hypothetical protein [Enterobacter cloacae]|uniref:hypothetical protein n=1 Tax=Enterobacter cloacae TaxID=550 RepID=UPI000ACD9361|nr:hypothetical protein [Enterobacter cloacae]
MQIALWAGKNDEVIEVYSRHQNYTLPARALAALAVAWRNKQEWKKALQVWDRICDESPYTAEFCRGRVLTLADSGEYDGALREIRLLQKRAPDSKNSLAEAYVHRLAGHYPEELLAITQAMRQSAHPEMLFDACVRRWQTISCRQPNSSMCRRRGNSHRPASARTRRLS